MGLFNLDYKIYCVQNLLEFLIIHQIVQIVLFEPLVLEFEVLFSALLPQIYVEVHVGASFVGVDYLLRFLVPLEPHLVLLVKPPVLIFQSLCSIVLSFCSLIKVEYEEQSIRNQVLEILIRVKVVLGIIAVVMMWWY